MLHVWLRGTNWSMANDGFHDEILWWLHFKGRQGKLPYQLSKVFIKLQTADSLRRITNSYKFNKMSNTILKLGWWVRDLMSSNNLKLKLFGVLETSHTVILPHWTKETKGRSSGQTPFNLKPKQPALKNPILNPKKILPKFF